MTTTPHVRVATVVAGEEIDWHLDDFDHSNLIHICLGLPNVVDVTVAYIDGSKVITTLANADGTRFDVRADTYRIRPRLTLEEAASRHGWAQLDDGEET